MFVIFSIVGLYFLFEKDKFLFFVISLYSLFGIASTILYFTTEYTLILPYQRILFQWAILLAISLAYLITCLISLVLKYLKTKTVLTKISVVVIMIALLMLLLIPGYYVVEPENYAIQRLVTSDQAYLLNLIKTSDSKTILANPHFSSAIYPLTGHKVISALEANIGGAESDLETYADFMKRTCDDQWTIAKQKGVDFVITETEIYCSFLKEISQKGNYYLYMVRLDLLPIYTGES